MLSVDHFIIVVVTTSITVSEIINAENGERIINLSQFMAANDLEVMDSTESDLKSQSSPKLMIDSDYAMSTQEPGPSLSSSLLSMMTNRQPSSTLALLNQSLVDHEKTVLAIS